MAKTPDFNQNKDFYDLIRKKNSPLPETGWNYIGPDEDHGVDFQNSWANSGASTVPASWYLDDDGEVKLRGKITGGDMATTIFTLPEEVRPEYEEKFIIATEDDVHLENIRFRAWGTGTGISVAPPEPTVVAVFAGRMGVSPWTRMAYLLDDLTFHIGNDVTSISDTNFANSITYNGTYWVAVSDVILTSTDGINWTDQGCPWASGAFINDVIWCNSLGIFVACQTGVFEEFLIGSTLDEGSDPTRAWDIWSTPWDADAGFVAGLAWSEDLGQILALGSSEASSGIFYVMMNSTDSETWTNVDTSPAVGGQLNRACWSHELGLWVAVGPAGDGDGVYSSTDGITWTGRVTGGIYTDVCWSPDLGLFVAVAFSTIIKKSTDGITWTNASSPPGIDLTGVAWSPTLQKFIAVYESVPEVYLSDDGDTWTALGITDNFSANKVFAI